MENDPSQQHDKPVEQSPQFTYAGTVPLQEQSAPKKGLGNYLIAGLGIIIGLAILLPASAFSQMLSYPIIILGLIAGINFFVDAMRANRSSNPLVKSFFILGGLGVGAVVFFICLIAGLLFGFANDPHPQPSG